MKDSYSEFFHEESRLRARTRVNTSRAGMLQVHRNQAEDGFACKHCGYFVSSAAFLSGVLNRNHCPYCLWSRHVDLFQPGDRLAACKAPMSPVGLALKQTTKRYTRVNGGELLVVHRCTGCSSISLNRIAADDDADRLLEVYEDSQQTTVLAESGLVEQPVRLLGAADRELVNVRLFGLSPVCCLEPANRNVLGERK